MHPITRAFTTGRGAILVTALTLAVAAAGASDAPSFRGVRFGVDISEQLPQCPKQYQSESQTCWEPAGSCLDRGPDLTCGHVHFHDALVQTVGWAANFIEQRGKGAVELTLYFPTAAFDDLERTFREKYGKPALSVERPWQSKGGINTKSHVRTWKWRGLDIEVEAPGMSIDQGFLIVGDHRYLSERQKARDQELKKKAGDL
jgi:hypothetical protein